MTLAEKIIARAAGKEVGQAGAMDILSAGGLIPFLEKRYGAE